MDVRLSKSGKIVLTGVLFPLGLLLGVGNLARVFNLQRNLFSNGEPSPTSVAFSTFEAHESLTLTDDERQLDKRLQTQSSLGILEPASSLAFEPVIDILSIGSRTRTVYQRSQENTFGQHRHVRRFEKVTEEIDSDQTCHTNLTLPEIDKIKEYCSYQNADVPSQAARLVRQFLFEPEPKPGWMCAQKRPIDAIYKALTAPDRSLPDYLFIVDDDTFLNMENVVKILGEQFRPDLPHKLTGCRFVYPRSIHFDFPYGGFGSILSRPVLENLLRPVDCESDDGFSQLACTRLTQNLMGERAYFENGMSLLELLYRFTSANPFTDVDNWKNSGYCFHSDHTLGTPLSRMNIECKCSHLAK